ncbi:hypothetical protein ABZ599_36660 [Streptomyces misionensis]|uniref:hypothetical protein n=1 Tax=Streptomyces misionensis TaxID=67331 RepID=UPI0033CDA8C9
MLATLTSTPPVRGTQLADEGTADVGDRGHADRDLAAQPVRVRLVEGAEGGGPGTRRLGSGPGRPARGAQAKGIVAKGFGGVWPWGDDWPLDRQDRSSD